ncbi:lasso peptide biosynthesis PqqD family chaperone [Bacillus sp. MUM 116]|uniref:lasso peptide biosynthesis PqqD family chaperone n=1 Tax=Bacillus sp. MUM 116 TaxID=1678002 RepID=UPI0021086A87|nr:lasso peptide biosynthesis PqqD family chaperone [Bacillus sp. MUM 116]
MIDPNQIFEQSKDVIVSNMGQEKVMLSIANGRYYNLGELGGDIWELLCEPKTINQLISELLEVYDVDRVQCEQQVSTFLRHLFEEQLIKFS